MSLQVKYYKYRLNFTFQAGTSRGVLTNKDTYFIKIYKADQPEIAGWGEAGPLFGLSIDDRPDFEDQLQKFCKAIEKLSPPTDNEQVSLFINNLVPPEFPAIRFGVETALLDLCSGGIRQIVNNAWSQPPYQPVPINGLVWMGDKPFMLEQIKRKLAQGFSCIKMKIGAIDFETELSLLAYIRQHFSQDEITLRVDANGAFAPEEAMKKLEVLSRFQIHSIEQPIQPGQWEAMQTLCKESPIPIALDEELIGVYDRKQREDLLQYLRPQFIILKPTLLGGLAATAEWIAIGEHLKTGWWVTSALESNIGLNAIAQFTSSRKVTLPQGLGTGQLYHNNIPSPLFVSNGFLHYQPTQPWDLSQLKIS